MVQEEQNTTIARRGRGKYICKGIPECLTDLEHRLHGMKGPMGRILIRGEYGHGIVDELTPLTGEPVIDKPGKDAFYATDLELILKNRGITNLIVCGVTTHVCVHTTIRAANDRGIDCLMMEDGTVSISPLLYH